MQFVDIPNSMYHDRGLTISIVDIMCQLLMDDPPKVSNYPGPPFDLIYELFCVLSLTVSFLFLLLEGLILQYVLWEIFGPASVRR